MLFINRYGGIPMFGFKNILDQLIDARRENEELRAKIVKVNSDIEYMAMMTDTELDQSDGEDIDGTI